MNRFISTVSRTPLFKREEGNALWFILIAILLLGGLTVLLSRGSTTSDDSGEFERMTIIGTEVVRYAGAVETGIRTLLNRGCSENTISLDADVDTVDGSENPDAPPDYTCHVFRPEGAAVEYKDIAERINTGLNTRYGTATASAMKDVGEDEQADLYLTIEGSAPLMKPFCDTINRMAKVIGPGTAPPGVFDPQYAEIEDLTETIFIGSFPVTADVATVHDFPELVGKSYFCAGISLTSTIFAYAIFAR